MIRRITITPKFSTREIVDSTIRKDWFILQEQIFNLGEKVHRYMQNYINKNRKRVGGTGRTANAITLHREAGAGLGRVFIGIGDLDVLNSKAPWWYVLNYGKTAGGGRYIPNHGNFVPGYFQGGDGRPDSSKAGAGRDKFIYSPNSGSGMYPKHPIRPINYIQASRAKLNRDIRLILNKLKRG